jgi:hypothetical protein
LNSIKKMISQRRKDALVWRERIIAKGCKY